MVKNTLWAAEWGFPLACIQYVVNVEYAPWGIIKQSQCRRRLLGRHRVPSRHHPNLQIPAQHGTSWGGPLLCLKVVAHKLTAKDLRFRGDALVSGCVGWLGPFVRVWPAGHSSHRSTQHMRT